MIKLPVLFLAILLMAAPATERAGVAVAAPETVVITSGALSLRALVWRPAGPGPFPAVLFNHGSYSSRVPMPLEESSTVGPVFARHGYVFLFLFRQGIGLSTGQGTADGDLMRRAFEAKGQDGRNRVQLQLLEGEELNETLAGLAYLRARSDVDAKRVAVAGHSFGGSLSLVLAARDPTLGAAVTFGGAAGSWPQSPGLRALLVAAVRKTTVPVFLVYAANDYSTAPGTALAAEMQRLGKPHRLKIYPKFGRDSTDGHNLVYRSVAAWEADVFAFLDAHLQPKRGQR